MLSTFAVLLDEERAIAALPKLLPEVQERRHAVDAARRVLGARGELSPENDRRLQRVEQILGVQAQGQELKSA